MHHLQQTSRQGFGSLIGDSTIVLTSWPARNTCASRTYRIGSKARTRSADDSSLDLVITVTVTGHALAQITEQYLVLRTIRGCVHPMSRTRGMRKRNQDNKEPESSVLNEK